MNSPDIVRSGDGWRVRVEDGAMIWEFRPGMDRSAFETEAYPVYEDLLEAHDVDALVTIVELEDPFTERAFEVWERAARRAARAGVGRWALVADGIKAISLRGRVDIGGLETLTTDDRAEAIEWAKAD